LKLRPERTNAIKKQTLKETKLQAQQIRDEAIDIGRKVEQCASTILSMFMLVGSLTSSFRVDVATL
jgi:hypothetical protein